MISNLSLEQNLITALLNKPEDYSQISSFFSEKDFDPDGGRNHSEIFTIIRQAFEKKEEINGVIVGQRLESLGITLDADISIANYVVGLSHRKCKDGDALRVARELKKLARRRKFCEMADELKEKMLSISPSASYTEILQTADEVYSKDVNAFEVEGNDPVDLYDQMEYVVEDRGNNPIEDFGMMGPFKTVNKIYGSLVRPGNIDVVCARAKAGKSSFGLYFCTHLAANYDAIILHLDNGEMSQEELIFRQAAALSGVKLHYIETGKWRKNPEMVKKVREVWPKVKQLKNKFYYFCVAGMSPEEMCDLAKKFYYSKVGRGNEMTISFDYLKTTGLLDNGKNEWQVVGEMVDGFKRLITKEILFEGKPKIGILTYVQANRAGIVRGKKADSIVDDESVVSLSDRISHLCTHLWYLRKKTPDELMIEGPNFGTHKFICFVARHLGEDVAGHLEPVKVGDELKDNFINLKYENFVIEDCGDLRDIVKARGTDFSLDKSPKSSDKLLEF